MKLSGIKFNRYKTIKDNRLDIEEDFTCLVGVNESGKSNVLKGIAAADTSYSLTVVDISRHSEEYLIDGSTPSLDLIFTPSDKQERDRLKELFGVDVYLLKLNKTGNKYRVDFPNIDANKSVLKVDVINKRKVAAVATPASPVVAQASNVTPATSVVQKQEAEAIDEEDVSELDLTDEEINEVRIQVTEEIKKMLPKFRYFDSVSLEDHYLPDDGEVKISELIASPEKYKPVINLLGLAGIKPDQLLEYSSSDMQIRRVTRLKKGSEKLNKELVSDFWPIKKVNIALTAEEDRLLIRIDDGKDFAPSERSRGLQWAIAFNVFFLSSAKEEMSNNILLLDEPGIFLHVDAQKMMLKSTFRNITTLGNQIIYTTHLPYLIDKDYPEKIRILEKPDDGDGSTFIGNKAWSEGEFGSIPEPVRTALGINLTDVLLGEINLVVEGPSDQIYFRDILAKFDPEFAKSVTFVPAYGAEKVPGVVGLALLSGKKVLGIVDGDKELDVLNGTLTSVGIKSRYIESVSSLVGSKITVTTEDIIPQQIFSHSVKNIYEYEYTKRKLDISKDSLPITLPRVQSLEQHFSEKFKSKKHKLLKMDIAKLVSNDIKRFNNVDEKNWSKSKKIVYNIKSKLLDSKIT